ncbi:MAG: AMP-binding protein [Desulfobacterales bacterium]|nr:MAG: AMP-binding protein [Desulfobacterales bacterium]
MTNKQTIAELVETRARRTPDDVYGIHGAEDITFRVLESRVNRLANGLAELGVAAGQRVAVILANHPDHIFTFFALAKLGAVWVPINTNLRGAGLEFIIEQSAARTVIADAEFWPHLQPILAVKKFDVSIVRNAGTLAEKTDVLDFAVVAQGNAASPGAAATLDEVRAVFFTSGTTGPPKGAPLTEKMLTTCAAAAGRAADVRPGDVFLLWEPIYHTSGAQMCVLALMEPVSLAIVPRFSASRFWDQIRKYHVTKLHYLGGILDILLKQPSGLQDRDHSVQIAFGAGCTKGTWKAFEQRFGVAIREVYGMTEASCFTTLNRSGKVGSIGKPYPHFEIRIVDDNGHQVEAGQSGEICVREKEPGLIVQGYLTNSDGAGAEYRDGWLYTGDLAYCDAEGDYYYLGRKKDSFRRRGENISAWEVEHIINAHPDIQESAVVGVAAEVGEQDLKVFIKCSAGITLDPLDFIKWCEPRMAYYQIPRYVVFVEDFEKTPTQRISKDKLSRDIVNCWDLEKSGYKINR